jgi:hypothetical protein
MTTSGKMKYLVMMIKGKLPRGKLEWNLPGDAAGSVSGLASDIAKRIPSRRAPIASSEYAKSSNLPKPYTAASGDVCWYQKWGETVGEELKLRT